MTSNQNHSLADSKTYHDMQQRQRLEDAKHGGGQQAERPRNRLRMRHHEGDERHGKDESQTPQTRQRILAVDLVLGKVFGHLGAQVAVETRIRNKLKRCKQMHNMVSRKYCSNLHLDRERQTET